VSEPTPVISYSRSYKIALTIAIGLFLVLLTGSILILILVNSREENRQSEFAITLTAVIHEVQSTQTAAAYTPTPAPPLTPGVYPFTLDGNPVYLEGPDCSGQVVSGDVLDLNGAPTDSFQVSMWGDFLARQIILTGEIERHADGHWSLALDRMVNRRLWVQVTAGDRYLSAPVEVVLDAAGCDRNRVEIIFRQTGALE